MTIEGLRAKNALEVFEILLDLRLGSRPVLANSLALFLLSGLSFSDMLQNLLVAFIFDTESQEHGNLSYLLLLNLSYLLLARNLSIIVVVQTGNGLECE